MKINKVKFKERRGMIENSQMLLNFANKIGLVGRNYGKNLSFHKSGPVQKLAKAIFTVIRLF